MPRVAAVPFRAVCLVANFLILGLDSMGLPVICLLSLLGWRVKNLHPCFY
jgi:hypothetical protein